MPGVVAVLTAADLPLKGGSGRAAEPLAREEIVWSGQPVALVIGETRGRGGGRRRARDGRRRAASGRARPRGRDRAGLARGAGDRGARRRGRRCRRARRRRRRRGRAPRSTPPTSRPSCTSAPATPPRASRAPTRSCPGASARTGSTRPTSSRSRRSPGSSRTASSSSPAAPRARSWSRQGLADVLGLPLDRVRVRAAPIGGAFGGKLMISEPLAAAAALKLRRPVRLVFGRREDFAAANPAPAELIDLELGATRDGTLTAIRGRIVGDRGALGEMGVETISAMLSAGPYKWAAHDLTAIGVATNRVSAGAYRAPGAPPAAFAVETLIDRLAAELGLDPIELRLKNVLEAGDRGLDGQEIKSFGARECLERVREHPLWQGRGDVPDGEGVGVAIGFWPGGLEPAARGLQARLRRAPDRRHRRRRHERHRERVHRDRGRGLRPLRGQRARDHRGHLERALRRRQRRQQDHLHLRPRGRARRDRGARAAAAGRLRGARDRPRGPRARRRRGPPARRARAGRSRSPTWRPRRTRSAARTPRSRATAASPRSAARRAPPRISRTSAWTARPAACPCSPTSSPRTSAAR